MTTISPKIDIYTYDLVRLGRPFWNWRQNAVRSPFWRAYWNDKPGAFIQVGSQRIELQPGRVVVLSPRTEFASSAKSQVRHFFVHFGIEHPYSDVPPAVYVFRSRSLVARAASIAKDLATSTHLPRTTLKVQILVGEILLTVPESDLPRTKRLDPRIAQAAQKLQKSDTLSNLELAKQSGMSRTSFCQLFRQEMGASPRAFSRRHRLEAVFLAIQSRDASVESLAEEMGFCDRYHLERAFKKEFGLTPAKFRKLSAEGKYEGGLLGPTDRQFPAVR